MSHKFAVDNSSDDEKIDETLKLLAETIKVGELAKKALWDIETKGYHDGQVFLCNGVFDETRWTRSIKSVHLDRYVEPTRDRAPPLKDLVVECGKMFEDSHGGHHFKACEVKLRGTRYIQKDRVGVFEDFVVHFGNLRLKKTGLSFEGKHDNYYNRYDVVTLPKIKVSPNHEAYVVVAKCVSDHVVVADSADKSAETQLTNDLRYEVRKWLIQEGVSQRIVADLVEQSRIVEVMNA